LLEKRFEHLIVLIKGIFLTGYSEPIQENLVVSLEEVVEVFKLFVLLRGKLLELVFHLF
jgi:hypothetical protein